MVLVIMYTWYIQHIVVVALIANTMSMQEMKKRCLYCPNLQVRKVSMLVPAPRPVKPAHPPIADLIKVTSLLYQDSPSGVVHACAPMSLNSN